MPAGRSTQLSPDPPPPRFTHTVLDREADIQMTAIMREEALASLEEVEARQAEDRKIENKSKNFGEFEASRFVVWPPGT